MANAIQTSKKTNFQPKYNANQSIGRLQHYKIFPHLYSDEDKNDIEEHAHYYNLPITREDTNPGLKTIITQAARGYVEGLTTFKMPGATPKNKTGEIAHSLGHLAGFAGMTGGAIAKAMGATASTQRLLGRLKGKSVPMLAGKAVSERIKKLAGKAVKGRTSAMSDSLNFLDKGWAKDSIEGAMELGIASAVSSWQGGVDEMMSGLMHGAKAGALFRGIGNFIGKGQEKGEKALRAVAGSLLQGMPSTLAGQTDVDQIYNYLLGAYFGYNESPYSYKKGVKHAQKVMKDGQKYGFRVEEHPDWSKLSPEAQKTSQEIIKTSGYGDFMQGGKLSLEFLKENSPEKFKKLEKIFKESLPDTMEFIGWDAETNQPLIRAKAEFAGKTILYRNQGKKTLKRVLEENERILSQDNPRDLLRELESKGVEGAGDVLKNYSEKAARKYIYDYYRGDYDFIKYNYKNQDERLPEYHSLKSEPNARYGRRYSEDIDAIKSKDDPSIGRDDIVVDKKQYNINEITNEIEVGDTIEIQSGNYYRNIVKRIKKDELDGLTDNVEKNNRIEEYAKPLENAIKSAIKKGGENAEANALKNIADKLGWESLPLKEEGNIRRIVKDKLQGKQSHYLDIVNGKLQISRSNKTIKGNDRGTNETAKIYEDIYYDAANVSSEQRFKGKRPVVIHQNFTLRDPKTGKTNEYSLLEYYHKLARDNGFDYKIADKLYLSEMQRISTEMNKDGYYYLGGKGDKQVNIFMRYHPKALEIAKEAPRLLKGARNVETGKSIGKDWLKAKNAFTDAFSKDFKNKKELNRALDKAFWSNVGYDLDFNGFPRAKESYEVLFSDPNFLKSAKDINKRMQILFTTGYSSNPVPKGTIKHLTKKGNFRFIIVDDAKLEQLTDGVFNMRDDVIKWHSRDAGVSDGSPGGDGHVKSFIVRKGGEGGNGGLLGKYMAHSSGDTLSAWMAKNKIHGVIFKSGLKQTGLRNTHTYEQYKKGEVVESSIYEFSPSELKSISSETTHAKSSSPQSIAKQMWSNFTPFLYSAKTTKQQKKVLDTFSELLDSLSGESYRGDKQWNSKLEKFVESGNKELIEPLINNIDKIGIDNLFKAFANPKLSEFTARAYRKILDMEVESMGQEVSEGEMAAEEIGKYKMEIDEFKGRMDRMVKNSSNENEIGVFMHKSNRPMLLTAKKNFLLNRAVKPKAKNSIVSRIRGADHHLMESIKRNNGKDSELTTEVFYLDNGHKSMRIEADFILDPKHKTLGELWKNRSKYSPEVINEFFSTIGVRVPMASMNGARQMKFNGFTGRDGYGTVMHPENLKALGGADSDGDKAYNFFGWKKSWRDLYHNQKNEMVDKNGKDWSGDETKFDPEIRKEVIREPDASEVEIMKKTGFTDIGKLYDSPYSKYSPFARMQMSKAASVGRAQLGPAVVQSSLMQSLHAHIMSKNAKEIKYYTDFGTIKITPKKDLMEFRKFKNALINFTADPMDIVGLKSTDVLFMKQFNKIFDAVVTNKKGSRKLGSEEKFSSQDSWVIRNLTDYKHFADTNSAFWGKNYEKNRQYESFEIKSLSARTANFPQETYLPKISKMIKNADLTESVFRRITNEQIENLYKQYETSLKEFERMEGYNEINEAMGRDGFPIKLSTMFKKIKENHLYEDGVIETLSRTEYDTMSILKNGDKVFSKPNKNVKNLNPKDKFQMTEKIWSESMKVKSFREEKLREFLSTAEDFMTNDLTDMVSVKLLSDIVRTGKISTKKFSEIFKKVEEYKRQHANRFTEAKQEGDRVFDNAMEEITGKKQKDPNASKMKTQEELDVGIREYKNKLKNKEKEVFDTLMLSSLNRGEMDLITGKETTSELNKIKFNSTRTSVSGIGLDSSVVSNTSIKKVFNTYNKMYKDMQSKDFTSAEKKTVEDSIENPYTFREIRQSDGTIVKGNLLEDPLVAVDSVKEFARVFDYKKAKQTKLTSENTELMQSIRDSISKLHNGAGVDFNGLVKGLVQKDISAMDIKDYKVLDSVLKDMVNGPLIGKVFGNWKHADKLPKWFWYAFPRTVSREMIKEDMVLLKRNGIFWTREGNMKVTPKVGEVLVPYTHLTAVQEYIHKASEFAAQVNIRKRNEFDEKFLYLDTIKSGEGNDIWNIAVAEMEYKKSFKLPDNNDKAPYVANFNKMSKVFDKIKRQSFLVTKGKDKVNYSARELVDMTKAKIQESNEYYHSHYIEANPEFVERFAKRDKNGEVIYRNPREENIVSKEPEIDLKKFETFIGDMLRAGKEPPDNMGLDFLTLVQRQAIVDSMPNRDIINKKTGEVIIENPRSAVLKNILQPTGKMESGEYYPHVIMNQSVSMKNVEKQSKKILKDPSLSKEQKQIKINKLVLRTHSRTGEWTLEHAEGQVLEYWDRALKAIASNKSKNADVVKWINAYSKAGSMHSRESHAGGYSTEPVAYHHYIKGLTDNYYKKISQFMGRRIVESFGNRMKEQGKGEGITKAFQNYMKLYIQDSMGYPSVIPESMMKDPRMNLDGTAYKWFADSQVAKSLNKMRDMLGVKDKKGIPSQLQGFSYEDIKKFSSLEARYQLASLLAHPKTAVGNIYGGTSHTIVSTGIKNWRNGFSLDYLKSNFNTNWNTKQDIANFTEKHGVIEEYLISELGLNPNAKTEKFSKFVKDAAKRIKKDPEMEDKTLMSLAKEYGISDSFFNKSAVFMRKSERLLRRQAFMAHLVQGYESFDGVIPYDHPYLIELAKKGVKSTQFLYSAPFRPAFARTSLGKVMTRFQLWAYNAVDFRKEIVRQGLIRSNDLVGVEGDRAKRLLVADMMSLALASVFPYSVFNASLPAPWNWAQDTSEWLLGDEKTRNKAFWGDKSMWPENLRPLQMVTPPIIGKAGVTGRDAFTAWTSGSWDKLATYTTASLFPGGRFARDLKKTYQNPAFLPEYLLGAPLYSISRELRARKEEDAGPKF